MTQVIGYGSFNMVPSFTRFIRNHPDEALSFYPILVDRLIKYVSTLLLAEVSSTYSERDPFAVPFAAKPRRKRSPHQPRHRPPSPHLVSLHHPPSHNSHPRALSLLTQDRIRTLSIRLGGLVDSPAINGAQVFKETFTMLYTLGAPNPRRSS